MTTILIVDDEKLDRNGIKLLLKREKEALEILEAPNGKAALSVLAENKVDILFSDIKMPYMNGLELTEKARTLYPNLEIVIFSGYNDFTFARTALRYGVVDYVLKPVDPAEFHKTYKRVIANISSRIADEEKQTMQEDYLKKYFLSNYLYTGSEEYRKNYEQICGMSEREAAEDTDGRNYSVCKKGLTFTRMILVSASGNLFETDEERFVANMKTMLGRDMYYLNLNSSEAVFFFQEKYTDYKVLAEQFYGFFRDKYETECYLAVSRELNKLEDLPGEFQRLGQLLEEKFYQPKQHVFSSDTVEQAEPEDAEDSEVLHAISEDIRLRDVARLRQDFQKLEKKYGNVKQYSEMYVKFVFSSIMKEIYEEMSSVDEKALSKRVDKLYRCRTIRGVLDITEACICELETYWAETNQGFRKEVAQVKNYIYHNYDQNLSVEMLAERVYLSAGYLSAVFKEETGMNLNRFIREVRMNKAKELLETTNMKISQIAKEVGFTNTSYFCRSFREFFGSTPESCRRGESNV